MIKCIICEFEKDKKAFSEEHIIPDSLGGTIKISDVCKECNEKMGIYIDSPFVNYFFNRCYRVNNKIEGKKGAIPQIINTHTLDMEGRKVEIKNDFSKELKLKIDPKVEEKTEETLKMIFQEGDPNYIKAKEGFQKKAEKLGKKVKIEIEKIEKAPETYTFKEELNLNEVKMGIFKITHEIYCLYVPEYKDSIDFKSNAKFIKDYIEEKSKNKNYELVQSEDLNKITLLYNKDSVKELLEKIKIFYRNCNLNNSKERFLEESLQEANLIFKIQDLLILKIGGTLAEVKNFFKDERLLIIIQEPQKKAKIFEYENFFL